MAKHPKILVAAGLATSLTISSISAQEPASLFEMSLEELMTLEVTSVSRRSESLAETASAVYVVTHEEIVRYGIISIPDALRLVPGLSVMQIDANKWAVGSRGFVGRFANKLLVLMDGRVLYTPTFSGVYWDAQDTLLEDIERIEVIRGPGSTAWGANAVNGVINIITRRADAEPGGKLATHFEDDGSHVISARYAFAANDDTHHRMFLKRQSTDGNLDLAGFDTADDWDMTRIGYRSDWTPSETDEFTFIAEAYDGTMGMTEQFVTVTPPYSSTREVDTDASGAFFVGRWDHRHSQSSSSTAQLVFDASERDSPQIGLHDRRTVDIDYQYHRTFARHDLVVGGKIRADSFDFSPTAKVSIQPRDPNDHQVSAFVQDQFALIPGKLDLTLGTKLEHNDLSDDRVEVMPSLRLLWRPESGPTLWAAATRSVRTPSYGDLFADILDIRAAAPPGAPENPLPLPMRFAVVGSPDFRSEELEAFELGLRGQLGPNVTYDLALFDMSYDEVAAYTPLSVVCSPGGAIVQLDPACLFASDSVITQLGVNNEATGSIRGAEIAMDWDAAEKLRFRASYAYTEESRAARPPSDTTELATGPEHQAMLRSEWSLNGSVQLAAWLRYVDEIPSISIEDYWQANVQINWRISDEWRVSIGGTNLLDSDRLEYMSELGDVVPTRIESTYFVRAEWGF